MSKKEIGLNAFSMNCVSHINHGLWTHPQDHSTEYKTIGYWTNLAQTLERGLFDSIFLADILGVYDVYGGSADVPLRGSMQLPVNDPMMLVSAMAAMTGHDDRYDQADEVLELLYKRGEGSWADDAARAASKAASMPTPPAFAPSIIRAHFTSRRVTT